ncbi:Lysine--tRNA ligase, partial [Hortaea werneckii]
METQAAKHCTLMQAMYILFRYYMGNDIYPSILMQHLHRCIRCFEEACDWANSLGVQPSRMTSGWKFCALAEYWIHQSRYARAGATEPELLSLIERLCHHFSFGLHPAIPLTDSFCPSELCPMRQGCSQVSVATSTTVAESGTLEVVSDTSSTIAKARSHFQWLHERLVAQGFQRFMPINELPADIYRIVVKHCVADGPHKLHDLMRWRDIRSFLSSSQIGYHTGVPILEQIGLLEIDLTENICLSIHEDGTQVSYDNYADGKIKTLAKSIRALDCLARYSTIMLKIPPLLTLPEQELDGDRWEKAHLNLEALRSAWRGYDVSKDAQMKISAEIHVANLVGKIPNLTRYVHTGERPYNLTATEVVMCTHRDHYGQMDEEEARQYNWVEPPEELTAPSQAFHFAFNESTSVELAHKLGVLTKLGDYFRKKGKKVLVREKLEAADGMEWPIPARPQCPRRRERCEFHAGADVKTLYMIADRMSPKSQGLWLCSSLLPPAQPHYHIMAAQQAADAVKDGVQAVADGVQSLTTGDNSANAPEAGKLLDEVTGEYISKTELKKRQKQREKEKIKAEKEATRKPPPPPKRKAGGEQEDESQLNPNQYFEIRSRAIKRMKETQNPNPYPHKFHVNYDLRNLEKEYGHLKKGDLVRDKQISIGCRIYNIRTAGENLRFYEVAVDGAETQIMATNLENTSSV